MSDIKEWALKRLKYLNMSAQSMNDITVQLAQEAYERGIAIAQAEASEAEFCAPSESLADRPASGMTIRQAFAMAAMQGMLGSQHLTVDADTGFVAEKSLAIADALIAALGKTEGKP